MRAGRRHLPRTRAGAGITRTGARSVNRTENFLVRQGDDHPFDLPPMAEFQDIAIVAAGLGARSSLEPGVIAVSLQKQCSVGKGRSAVDVGRVHSPPVIQPTFLFRTQIR